MMIILKNGVPVEHLLSRLASDQIWPGIEKKTPGYKPLPDALAYFSHYCTRDDWHLYRLSGLTGCAVQFVFAELGTFVWNFGDLFVMLVSLGLLNHLNFFNKCMNSPGYKVNIIQNLNVEILVLKLMVILADKGN